MSVKNKSIALKILISALILLAITSIVQSFNNAIRIEGSQDFQYSAAKLLIDGKNAYQEWKTNKESFLLAQSPNYLPLLFILVTPIASLDWSTAKIAWASVNIIIAIFLSFRIFKLQQSAFGILLALLFLTSTPVRNTIGNGQHGLIVMLAIYLAIEYKNSFAKGFFISLSLVKYSIGVYFLALSTTKNSYSLLISLIFTVISYVVFSFATNSHITVELIISPLKVTENGMALSRPYDWIKDKLGHSSIILISLIGVASSNFLCIRTKFQSNNKAIEGKLVIATTLCCLTFSPHLGYDYLMLWLPFPPASE